MKIKSIVVVMLLAASNFAYAGCDWDYRINEELCAEFKDSAKKLITSYGYQCNGVKEIDHISFGTPLWVNRVHCELDIFEIYDMNGIPVIRKFDPDAIKQDKPPAKKGGFYN